MVLLLPTTPIIYRLKHTIHGTCDFPHPHPPGLYGGTWPIVQAIRCYFLAPPPGDKLRAQIAPSAWRQTDNSAPLAKCLVTKKIFKLRIIRMNEETPSPTVGGSIDPLDDDAAAPLALIDHHRSSVRSGDARSASGGSGGGTTRRAFRTPLARSPRPPVRAAAAPPPRAKVSDGGGAPPLLTRPERLLRQEMGRLKRQNSDPSPALKRRPKFEIMPPPSPNASSLFERPISPVYRHQIDEDLLQVPLRSGTSPSVVSFQSDPESCLDGLYTMKYGEDDDDYEEPFSIGGAKMF
uniref:Uncharacterized protein n=1 Tax=Globodera rostochiensis TaxID=31243 RepID=A0A914I941_GLORO